MSSPPVFNSNFNRITRSFVTLFVIGVQDMKVAMLSERPNLDACLKTDFRRSRYLLIVDMEAFTCEATSNPMLSSGTTPITNLLHMLMAKGIRKVLVPACRGADVGRSLSFAGTQVIEVGRGRAADAIHHFREVCTAKTVIMPAVE